MTYLAPLHDDHDSGGTPQGDPPLPSVLVLLGTRNGRPWLDAQLDSILAQRGVRTSIYIADDQSTDETWEVLRSRAERDARISLCRRPSPSGSAGANYRRLYMDAEIGTHDFVALADQDDEWLPDKLVRAIGVLRERHCAAYSGAVTAAWPGGKSTVLTQCPKFRRADFLFEGAGQGCTFVIETRLFERVQRFCLSHPALVARLHYHDWLLYLLARAWSESWCFDAAAFMRYRQHASNEIGARGGLRPALRRLVQIRNGWYRDQVNAACQIYRVAGGSDRFVLEFSALVCKVDGSARPLRNTLAVMWAVLLEGRRRLSERMLLVFLTTLGWL